MGLKLFSYFIIKNIVALNKEPQVKRFDATNQKEAQNWVSDNVKMVPIVSKPEKNEEVHKNRWYLIALMNESNQREEGGDEHIIGKRASNNAQV